ncbi:MAG: hypothetical protein HFG80_00140 [Eubacterium sp.]|nr:hypothetical protein [Eubacterium sp.]
MDYFERAPVTEQDKMKSYYKYFNRELEDISAEKKKILEHPMLPEGTGLELSERNKIFDDGYLPDEIGVSRLKSGGYCFANQNFIPGGTGEMLQWWFAWHPLDNLRYRIWDPRDHYEVGISEETRKKLMDPDIPLIEKCQNVKHSNRETVLLGTDPISVVLTFMKPSDMGWDESKIGTEKCSFFVCGNVVKPEGGGWPIVIMHSARDVKGGCEHRSRIWVGYQIKDGKEVCVAPEHFEIPIEGIRNQLQHHFFEFINLAAILPQIYEEEKNNW